MTGIHKQASARQRHGAFLLRSVMLGACGLLLASCQVLSVAGKQAPAREDLTVSLSPSANPVTVDSVSRGDRFARLAAAQHPKILATYGGDYPDPKLERMVAKVVGSLTFEGGDPNQTYRVTILNSPNVNAFALPGGFVYVTRGLLALANDSSELAAVIAHEMAHVTARHGIERQKLEADANLAARVVSEVLQDDTAGKQAAIRGKLKLAQFSRNQELEADAIGIKSAGKSGYDPYGAPRFLASLGAYTNFRAAADDVDMSLEFLASHPATPQRVELASRHARIIGPEGTGTKDRDSYLNGVDGMLFGDSPEEGFVRGNMFLHPNLGIAYAVPQGFETENNKDSVLSSGPGETAIRFDAVELLQSVALTDYVRSGWVTGLDAASVQSTTIAGYEAAVAKAQADRWSFEIAVMRVGSKVYRFLFAAPVGSSGLSSVSTSVVQSFRVMTPEERTQVRPARIRVVTVQPGESVGALANRMTGVDRKLEHFRLLNGLTNVGTVSAGQRVKLITLD